MDSNKRSAPPCSTAVEHFEKEVRPLSGGELLHAPARDLSPEEAVAAFAIMAHLENVVKARKGELRRRILEDPKIIDNGKGTPSGGTTTSISGNSVQRRRVVKKFANEDRIRQTLAKKSLGVEAVFDSKKVTTVETVVNPSKVQYLLDTGVFSAKDVESFHKEQWSLVVQPSERLVLGLRQTAEGLDRKIRN